MLRKFNEMSLIELLEYVYAHYPHYIKKSLIVERVLRTLGKTGMYLA